jgi:hypothetical protein
MLLCEATSELGWLEAIPMVGVVKPPQRHNEVAYLLMKGVRRTNLPRFALINSSPATNDSR